MSVFITGGGGFIALSLAEKLLARKQKVVLFGTSVPSEAFLARLNAPKGLLECEVGDVTNEASISGAILRHRPAQIVHGATITAAVDREVRGETGRIIEVNLLGTVKVLEASLAAGVKRVICCGSGSSYGAQTKAVGLLHEEDPAVPDTIYGITKLALERMALRYRATRGLDAVTGRIGIAFGPWEHGTRSRDTLSSPYVLLDLARNGQEARILRRVPNDWVDGGDIADALLAMLDAEKLNFGVYNLGSGKAWDVAEWCQALQVYFPKFAWRLVDNPEEANVGRLSPLPRPPLSIDRIVAELGWRPKYLTVDVTMRRLLQWHGVI